MSSSYIRDLYTHEEDQKTDTEDAVYTPIALKLAQAQNHPHIQSTPIDQDLDSVPPLPFNMDKGSVDFPDSSSPGSSARLGSQRTPSSGLSSARSSIPPQNGYSELSEFQWGEEEMRSGPQGFGGVPSLAPQPQPEELTEAWSSMLEPPPSSKHKIIKLIGLMLLVISLGIGVAFVLPYLFN
jgi:hypothetical protein